MQPCGKPRGPDCGKDRRWPQAPRNAYAVNWYCHRYRIGLAQCEQQTIGTDSTNGIEHLTPNAAIESEGSKPLNGGCPDHQSIIKVSVLSAAWRCADSGELT